MIFQLERPWTECVVKTKIGKRFFKAKVDTGASITVIGGLLAEYMGIDLSKVATCPCVVYFGVTGHRGYAFRVPIKSIPMGTLTLPVKYIHIPFEIDVENKTCKFVTPDKFLIGMDVLIDYNMRISYENTLGNEDINNATLELTSHKLTPHQSAAKHYKFQDILNTVGKFEK